jgi:hypothetical protein
LRDQADRQTEIRRLSEDLHLQHLRHMAKPWWKRIESWTIPAEPILDAYGTITRQRRRARP